MLREEKIPVIVNILENAWRRFKIRLALTKFIAAHNELNAAYTAVATNVEDRRKRRMGANDKSRVAALYATWNQVSGKLLEPENHLSLRLADDEHINSIVFAQSFVRAQNGRRAFLALKRAQIVFSKRYRGLKARKQLSPELWESCKKVLLGVRTEFERYMGKKKRRRDTLDREYKADYVGFDQFPAYSTILHAKGPQKLLFAAAVIKVNERFVHQPRTIVVGDKRMYNLKTDKVYQPKERRVIELSRITGIFMSSLPDNYVVIQVKSEFDMMLVTPQKIELVQVLRKRIKEAYHRELTVTIADSFEYMALKKRPQTVMVVLEREIPESEPRKIGKRTLLIAVGKS
jgi:hypothetical protein